MPAPDPPRVDASRYVGTYTCDIGTVVVTQHDDGRVWMDTTPTGSLAEELGEQPERWELVHHAGDTLITRERDHGLHRLYAFLGDEGAGHSLYLHAGRAIRRAGA